MTYQPSICIITPTIGRPTLRQALESGAKDLDENDLWIIFADGLQTDTIETCEDVNFNCGDAILESVTALGDYGNPLRDQAMSIASQDYFIFLDDDDVFAPNAIPIIKREIAEHHPRPIMFRMINGNGELLWRTREVATGNVGGSMFCCPNTPGRLGTWANGRGHQSDLAFIEETLKLYGPGWRQNLFWSGDVIVHCRPEAGGMAMLTKAEATEILDTKFDSVCFGKAITVRLFLINLFERVCDNPRQEFECDMGCVIRIIRKVKCFSEHNFKMAGELFYELCSFLKQNC